MRCVLLFALIAAVSHAHVRMYYTGYSIRNANTPTANGGGSTSGPCGGQNTFGKNGINKVAAGSKIKVQVGYAAGHADARNVFKLAYKCGKIGDQTQFKNAIQTTGVTPAQIADPKAVVGQKNEFEFTIPATAAGTADGEFCTISLMDQRFWGGCVDLQIGEGGGTAPTAQKSPTPATSKPTTKPPTAKAPTAANAPTTAAKTPTAAKAPTAKTTAGAPTGAAAPTTGDSSLPSDSQLQNDCPAGQVLDCNGNCWGPFQKIKDSLRNGKCNDYEPVEGMDLNCKFFQCDGGDCDECPAVDRVPNKSASQCLDESCDFIVAGPEVSSAQSSQPLALVSSLAVGLAWMMR